MSLENKIELLTSAVEMLIARIDAIATANITSSEPVEPEHTPEPEQSEKKLTHKDVQDFLLSFVRKDADLKPKIKKLLSEFSASKVSDIELDKLADFKSKVEKL